MVRDDDDSVNQAHAMTGIPVLYWIAILRHFSIITL